MYKFTVDYTTGHNVDALAQLRKDVRAKRKTGKKCRISVIGDLGKDTESYLDEKGLKNYVRLKDAMRARVYLTEK